VIRTPLSRKLGEAAEGAVVALAMNGDDAAYGELVRRRQAGIRRMFRRLTRDPALADDLAQQTFVQAWKSIRSLRSPAAFGAWLRRLAVNCWLQQARIKQHEVLLGDAALQGDEPLQGREAFEGQEAFVSGPPSTAGATQAAAEAAVTARMDLDAALAALPPAARLCVVLAYSEGMSHAEISESTAMALGTVKSHIARGAARLRELLQGYGDAHVR
jgi:RNA polymerase sigma-70 factor, ECF subfamily